jgi:eukaryotic-like serine/threonine-protein kinase
LPTAPGTLIGPFEVVSLLGSGGMGDVYRGRDTRLGREVALKVLPAHLADDREGLARFAHEARAASALNHPNIVTIYDIGKTGDAPFLAMEFVNGRTLRDVLKEGPVTLRRLLDVAAQLTDGLASAHGAGIVHRDLKPENLMLSADGFLKILDFGIAKLAPHLAGADLPPALTSAGLVVGTPGYMSPEQASGRAVDFRSDQFSVGLILYELATGRRAFERETPVETLSAIIREEPEPLSVLAPRLPAPVRWVIERCLAKDPEERYASSRDLAREWKQLQRNADSLATDTALQTAVTSRVESSGTQRLRAGAGPSVTLGSPVPAVTHAPPPKRESGARRASRVVAASLGALALVAGGGALGYWLRQKSADAPAPAWSGSLVMGGSTRVLSPRSSPDGRRVAFLTPVGGLAQVAAMEPESGDWTVLTKRRDAGSVRRVEWSPDGTRLFFDRVTDAPLGVSTVPAIGGEERLVVEGAQSPDPLPDGSLLVSNLDAERRFQIVRVWPDSGKQKAVGPPVLADSSDLLSRALPGGREVLVWGRLAGAKDAAGRRLHVIDVETGAARPFLPELPLLPPFLPLRDGTGVLARLAAGDLHRIVAAARDGSGAQTLLSFSSRPRYLAEGAHGTLYVGFSDGAADLLRVPASGGLPERLATVPAGLVMTPVEFEDGRLLVPGLVAGRRQILVTGESGDLRPFTGLAEPTFGPATLAGRDAVAFLTGPPASAPLLAVVARSDGRLLKKHALPKGAVPSSLAASRDGRTLFFADGGTIWAVDVASGAAKPLCTGHGVAGFPDADDVLVQRNAASAVQLVRVSLATLAETPVLAAGPLRLAPAPLSGGAVGPDGRILVSAVSPDTWLPAPAILDPATGALSLVPVRTAGETLTASWGHGGSILAMVLGTNGEFWSFRPKDDGVLPASSGR